MFKLDDSHWNRIRSHFPEESIEEGRPGRNPVPSRKALEAVLWILNMGVQWHMLPLTLPLYFGHPAKRFNIAIRGERYDEEESGSKGGAQAVWR